MRENEKNDFREKLYKTNKIEANWRFSQKKKKDEKSFDS